MKTLLTSFFILVSTICSAQLVYFTYGYTGNSTNLDGLNQVIRNYNTSRQWLDQEMDEISYLDGLAINTGLAYGGAFFEFEYSGRGKKKSAFGTDLNGNFGTRELKVKNNTMAMSVGFGGGGGNGVVALAARAEFGTTKIKTRAFYEGEDKPDMEILDEKHLFAKAGPMLKILLGEDGICGSLSLYYVWGVIHTDMTPSDEILNNTFYNYDSPPEFKSTNNTFGFTLSVGFFGEG